MGNTAVSGMAAAVNSTANVMAAGLPTFGQFNAALQNATGIATSNQVVGLTNMLANANGNLQTAGEAALQSLGNQPGVAQVAAGFSLGMPALPPVIQVRIFLLGERYCVVWTNASCVWRGTTQQQEVWGQK